MQNTQLNTDENMARAYSLLMNLLIGGNFSDARSEVYALFDNGDYNPINIILEFALEEYKRRLAELATTKEW